jgi:hypothetical protein
MKISLSAKPTDDDASPHHTDASRGFPVTALLSASSKNCGKYKRMDFIIEWRRFSRMRIGYGRNTQQNQRDV